MVVVGVGHHVLHDDPLLGVGIAQHQVGAERPDANFSPIEVKIDSEGFAQRIEIFGEPGSDIPCLVLPDVTDGNRHEAVNGRRHVAESSCFDGHSSIATGTGTNHRPSSQRPR